MVSKYPLYDYQQQMCADIRQAWQQHTAPLSDTRSTCVDIIPVMPTGSGKTRTMAEFGHAAGGIKLYQAHRRELVGQIALAIAKENLPHRVIGDKSLINFITDQQIEKLGYTTYSPTSDIVVVSAQTLANRNRERWWDDVEYFFSDEGHHGLRDSVWGKNRVKFPMAKGLWPTATPIRADGAGLGRHADGFADAMIIGPDMRNLIHRQKLADYDLVMDETDIELSKVAVSNATGDYVNPQLVKALKESRIVGDTVDSYLQYASGRLAVVFTADVDLAESTAKEFRDRGISAEAISARNTDKERADIGRRFERRQTLVLVNCDLLGEGYDVPGIEVCIMDRPTESYGLFVQQWGRALRYLAGKRALIIDKVGNARKFMARGFPLPDNHHAWTLDRRDRAGKAGKTTGDGNRVCDNIPACGYPYDSALDSCPWCGHTPEKQIRTGPDRVDGDLRLLTYEELQLLQKQLVAVSQDADAVKNRMLAAGAPSIVALSAAKNIRTRTEAREQLQAAINTWAGMRRDLGYTESEAYTEFYRTFGVDTISAQLGTAAEMIKLSEAIKAC